MALMWLRRWRARNDPVLEDLLSHLPGDVPFVVVENVTRYYPDAVQGRLEQFFMRFGGITPEKQGGFEDEDDADDENDEDELFERPDVGMYAIRGVSLTLSGGSCLALVGPEGSGKSTLIEMIGGLVPLTEGKIVVRGVVLPALAMMLGLHPKGTPLRRSLPVVAGFVGMRPRIVRERMDAMAELVGEPDLHQIYPRMLKARRREHAVIGSMLALEGDVILADLNLEPGGVRDKLADRLRELKAQGAAVIVSARDPEWVADIADRVLFLREGHMVAELPIEEALPFAAAAAAAAAAQDDERALARAIDVS